MTLERWRQAEELFYSALARASHERAAFLDSACRGDEELRREVESLLAAHERDGSFLDSPAYEGTAGRQTEDRITALVGRDLRPQRDGLSIAQQDVLRGSKRKGPNSKRHFAGLLITATNQTSRQTRGTGDIFRLN